MFKSICSTLIIILPHAFLNASLVIAGEIKPYQVTCYFFKQGQLILKDKNCIREGWTWTGGGGVKLRWSDGVVTQIKWGLQGRGTPVCQSSEETEVDGVCGKRYELHPTTLRTLRSSELNRYPNAIYCTQLKQKSICSQSQYP